jgi:hypothetical protein
MHLPLEATSRLRDAGLRERRRSELFSCTRGDAFALKTHISHIRQKLGIQKGEPGCIASAPHIGCRLERGSPDVLGVSESAA